MNNPAADFLSSVITYAQARANGSELNEEQLMDLIVMELRLVGIEVLSRDSNPSIVNRFPVPIEFEGHPSDDESDFDPFAIPPVFPRRK